MNKILLISPHFDDAVLGAGQFLAGRPDADVVTVFGGEPKTVVSTPYDQKCGFSDSKDAIAVRRIEDDTALSLLNATPIHWGFPDSQYGEELDEEKIYKMICSVVDKGDYEMVLAPVGIGHPDHELVGDLVKRAAVANEWDVPVYFWEDLPLRVLEPELISERLKKLGLRERAYLGDGLIVKKIRALTCYYSQIGTGILDPFVMYVPERFWKL